MKKGDIVLVPFPFTDLTATKKRPALVLIDSIDYITVSFITTQLRWQDEFDVRLEPSLTNGLKRSSLIRLSKITTVDKKLVIGKLGSIGEPDKRNINHQLLRLLDISDDYFT